MTSFDEMSNLPKKLRFQLAQECFLSVPQVERKQVSVLDGTIKYLWRLEDGNCIETVLMRYQHGNTVCVSCQVGCNMGCVFCASTRGGKVRDLKASEILDQVLFTQLDSGEAVSNIVMMGIGEPLDNFEQVLRFLTLVNHPDGIHIGMRHISLSTCGLIEKIDKLAGLGLQLTLSVSLHAPDDETRSRLMPVNRAVGVDRLMETCRRYFETTGRRISYEYAMVDGVNDSDRQADLLAALLKGQPGHVNLIPLNHVAESPLKAQQEDTAISAALGEPRRDRNGAAQAGWRYRRILWPTPAEASPGARKNPERKGYHTMNLWGVTDIGAVRNDNQDSYRMERLDEHTALAVVCDGMGGARAGNVASSTAVERFTQTLIEQHPQADGWAGALRHAVARANEEVYSISQDRPECRGMGTTLVAALATEETSMGGQHW